MINQFKALFKHSFFYGLGSVAQSLVGFILIPIYTRYLSTSEYGQLEILNTILTILIMISSLGFASALLKCHERDVESEEERKKLIGTTFIFVLPIASFISFVLWLFSKEIALWFLGDDRAGYLVNLILISNIVSIFAGLALSVLRAKERSLFYTLLVLLRFAIAVSINIYLVVFLKMGVFGILLGNLISQGVISLSFVPQLLRFAKFSFSRRLLRKLLAFGIPIIPASLAMWVMDLSDRYFLKFFTTLHEVGLYSLGYKIGMAISILLVTPLQLAWPTISFAQAKRPDVKIFYAKVLTYFLLVSSFCALALSSFAFHIVRVLSSENFYNAFKIIPFIAFSYVFFGVHFILVPGLHLKEKTKYYPLLVIIPAVLNLILNFIFVPLFGMTAAASTTLVCFVFMALLTYFITNRFYPIKYEWSRLGKIVFVSLAVLGGSLLARYINASYQIVINTLLLISFPAILYICGFFEKKEIVLMINFVRRFIKRKA